MENVKKNRNDFKKKKTKQNFSPKILQFSFFFFLQIRMSSGASNPKTSAQLLAEANKKAKSATGFFQRMTGTSNVTNDDARELFIQAGNAAKAESDYPKAVDAYKRALDLCTEDYERSQMYEAISSSYKMFDLPQAIGPLTRAAELHMAQGKWTMASQVLEKVAELYEEMNESENQIKCLKEAWRFAKQEGQKAAMNRIQKRMAEIFVLQRQFIQAQEEYEQMAEKSKDDAMLKYNAKDFWLRFVKRLDISRDRRQT